MNSTELREQSIPFSLELCSLNPQKTCGPDMNFANKMVFNNLFGLTPIMETATNMLARHICNDPRERILLLVIARLARKELIAIVKGSSRLIEDSIGERGAWYGSSATVKMPRYIMRSAATVKELCNSSFHKSPCLCLSPWRVVPCDRTPSTQPGARRESP